jgi:hypothetical protein
MSDFLIAAGVAVLLGVGFYLVKRKSGTKEERRRAKATRDATVRRHAPMTEEEQELADAWHEDVQQARTGDLPKYRDPSATRAVRDAVRRYQRKGKHSTHRVPKGKPAASPLDGPLPAQLEQTVMLPGPAPAWHLESFSTSWTKAEIADIVAKGKAGASR